MMKAEPDHIAEESEESEESDDDSAYEEKQQKNKSRKKLPKKAKKPRPHQSHVTLGGLLNVLDGPGAKEGRLVGCTTNSPYSLDEALACPGCIDRRIFLGKSSKLVAAITFARIFGTDPGLKGMFSKRELNRMAKEFGDVVPSNTFTPCEMQQFCMNWRGKSKRAIGCLDACTSQFMMSYPPISVPVPTEWVELWFRKGTWEAGRKEFGDAWAFQGVNGRRISYVAHTDSNTTSLRTPKVLMKRNWRMLA